MNLIKTFHEIKNIVYTCKWFYLIFKYIYFKNYQVLKKLIELKYHAI